MYRELPDGRTAHMTISSGDCHWVGSGDQTPCMEGAQIEGLRKRSAVKLLPPSVCDGMRCHHSQGLEGSSLGTKMAPDGTTERVDTYPFPGVGSALTIFGLEWILYDDSCLYSVLEDNMMRDRGSENRPFRM